MNPSDNQSPEPAVLPELEALLVRAARRRAGSRRRPRRRWFIVAIAAALVLAAGAAAATGLLTVDEGHTAHGAFTVERRPVPAAAPGEPSRGKVCLQLDYEGRGPSYGCGDAPTAAEPFGLLVADSLAEGSRERVLYGLVAGDVARVAVLGEGGEHTFAATEEKAGLPGRFFAVVVPHLGRIEVVGYGAHDREVARIGSLARPGHPPLSKAEAIEQGDPAGFAPTLPPPGRWVYEGRAITEAEATRLGLACVEGRVEFTCHRSSAGVEAAGRELRRAEAPRGG